MAAFLCLRTHNLVLAPSRACLSIAFPEVGISKGTVSGLLAPQQLLLVDH